MNLNKVNLAEIVLPSFYLIFPLCTIVDLKNIKIKSTLLYSSHPPPPALATTLVKAMSMLTSNAASGGTWSRHWTLMFRNSQTMTKLAGKEPGQIQIRIKKKMNFLFFSENFSKSSNLLMAKLVQLAKPEMIQTFSLSCPATPHPSILTHLVRTRLKIQHLRG